MPFFIKKGGKNKKASRGCSYEVVIEDELPVLHRLIFNFAKAAKIKSCITKVTDINEKDSYGRSALHLAASISNVKALIGLLECGLPIDVDIKDNDGKTPLFKAVEVFSTECVLILIEHGASPDVTDKNQSAPLHLATVNKKSSVIAIICNSNGNINVKDEMGYSPLHVAAAFGYLDIAKLLIECGADIHSRDNHGRTPLMAASCEGTPKMVRLLLEYGSDPSLIDNHNQTAADYSLQNQSESMSKILKEAIGQRKCLLQTNTEGMTEDSRNVKTESLREPLDKTAVQEPEQNIEVIENTLEAPTPATNEIINKGKSQVEPENNENERHSVTKAETYLTQSRVEMIESTAKSNGSPLSQLPSETRDVKSEIVINSKSIESTNLSSSAEARKESLIRQLRIRNRQLRESNTSLRKKLSEILKQSTCEKEQQQNQLNYEKARLQYLNLRNQHILGDKIKECFALEKNLYQAYEALVNEIEKSKDGSDIARISNDLIRGMRRKMSASDAKIIFLKNQLESGLEEKNLLETEVESLRSELIILKDSLTKKQKDQAYFDEIKNDSHDDHELRDALAKFYEGELEKSGNDNEVLLNSVNKLRQENAMLKEQHFCNRQETIMLNAELKAAKDQIRTLQLQLESINSKGRESIKGLLASKSSYSSGNGLGRANSDSTVYGFRTYDSTSDFSYDFKPES